MNLVEMTISVPAGDGCAHPVVFIFCLSLSSLSLQPPRGVGVFPPTLLGNNLESCRVSNNLIPLRRQTRSLLYILPALDRQGHKQAQLV